MVAVELLVGAVFLIVSVCAFWFALPRGGEVRGYLRNEQVTTRSRWSLLHCWRRQPPAWLC